MRHVTIPGGVCYCRLLAPVVSALANNPLRALTAILLVRKCQCPFVAVFLVGARLAAAGLRAGALAVAGFLTVAFAIGERADDFAAGFLTVVVRVGADRADAGFFTLALAVVAFATRALAVAAGFAALARVAGFAEAVFFTGVAFFVFRRKTISNLPCIWLYPERCAPYVFSLQLKI